MPEDDREKKAEITRASGGSPELHLAVAAIASYTGYATTPRANATPYASAGIARSLPAGRQQQHQTRQSRRGRRRRPGRSHVSSANGKGITPASARPPPRLSVTLPPCTLWASSTLAKRAIIRRQQQSARLSPRAHQPAELNAPRQPQPAGLCAPRQPQHGMLCIHVLQSGRLWTRKQQLRTLSACKP
jgi:hypothetical protein